MTYTDAIEKLLNKAGDELTYPVNISFHFLSAIHIQFELDKKRDINEILKDEIKYNDLCIEWLDKQNKINLISMDDDYRVSKSYNSSDESTIESFNNKQFTQIVEDGKYRLLLYPLEENVEVEENGFVKKEILDYEKGVYELEEVLLPKFEGYKYKNLYVYDNEEEFINAILLEFILRHINYNNLAPNTIKTDIPVDKFYNLSEEELDFLEYTTFHEMENEINTKLINTFGLSYDEINKLKFIYNKRRLENLEKNNIIMKLKSTPPFLKKIKINLTLSLERLIEQVTKLKNDFDREIESCLNLKERVSKEYLIKANEVLEKFPKSFEKKKDDLIKALFIFDYIQAYNKNIDELNIPTIKEYETKKNKIQDKYLKKEKNLRDEIEKFEAYKKEVSNFEEKIKTEKQNNYQKAINELEKSIKTLEKDKKKELQEIEKELKDDLIHHTKMDPSKYENSIFNNIASIIDEKPKQCTKIHSFIHKFLEKQITN